MWSSKSLGSAFQHGFFRMLIRLHMLSVARLLLYPVSFWYALRPSICIRYSYYLKHRFANITPFKAFWLTSRAYCNFAHVLLDRMTLRCTGTLHVVQNEETIKNLHDILAEGHGCLLVSAHFGSWQVGLLGLEQLGRPIHIVQWTKNGDIDPHYFQGTHMQHDIHIIDPAQGLSAIVQIYNALRHNDIVCMMGDRLRDYEKEYTTVNFLGDSIRIPNAPWVIASQTSSPVLHTFSIRKHGVVTGLSPLLVRVPSGIRKSPELLKTLILRFTGHLEMLTAEYPCDFFNFYDMWSTEDDQV